MAEETTAPDAEKPAKSGKGKLMLIVGLLVLVAGGAGAAWYLQLLPGTKKAEAKQEAAEAPKPAVGALLALDPFIANLGDEDGKRYLKASLQVEFFGRACRTSSPPARRRSATCC